MGIPPNAPREQLIIDSVRGMVHFLSEGWEKNDEDAFLFRKILLEAEYTGTLSPALVKEYMIWLNKIGREVDRSKGK